jgi:hypothetical protein
LNGTHDFAYPLDSYAKSYRLVRPSLRHLSIVHKLPHGHIWSFPEVDQFVDAKLNGSPFPRFLQEVKKDGEQVRVQAMGSLKDAQLIYTPETGPWDKREWKSISMQINRDGVEINLPKEIRRTTNLVMIVTGTTADGLRISTEPFQAAP